MFWTATLQPFHENSFQQFTVLIALSWLITKIGWVEGLSAAKAGQEIPSLSVSVVWQHLSQPFSAIFISTLYTDLWMKCISITPSSVTVVKELWLCLWELWRSVINTMHVACVVLIMECHNSHKHSQSLLNTVTDECFIIAFTHSLSVFFS